MHPLSWITKVSTAALTNCNLETIKCFEHLWSFHTFKFGNILFATKEIPAQCQMFGFASGTKQSIMPNSNKTFRGYMHEKTAYKFSAGNGILFPFAFFTVIFYIISYGIIIHTNNTMVTDCNSVCIFSKVVDYRLSTIKGFLTVRDPIFFITDV